MRGSIPTIISAAAVLAVAACASPASRIAGELTKAGVDPVRARCVGQSLEADLSIAQLRELAAAARSYRDRPRTSSRTTIADLIRVSAQIRDPAIAIALGTAAGRCATLGGRSVG
jgi:hypothetical protein